MKILLTGSNGYIGSRLLQLLLEQGHDVVAMVRHSYEAFQPAISSPQLQIVAADLLYPKSLQKIPDDIDAAYYLVHSMAGDKGNFSENEKQTVANFIARMQQLKVKQIVYLGGLCSDRNLSMHLASRYQTEKAIKTSGLPYTILRAGIIIGSGSASFEIIRDLTEKLPLMVAPRWVNNLCQPIAVQDVLYYLVNVLNQPGCINQSFDVGGSDILSYKNMLLAYADERELKRKIIVVPVLTPRLSSYWLYFVTSVNFGLASALVDSIKNEAVCQDNRISQILPHQCLSYNASIRKAFDLIEQSPLIPSWKDSLVSNQMSEKLALAADVPHFGCLIDKRVIESDLPFEKVRNNVWSIGGNNGWYSMDWAWGFRGLLDKMFGGVGLQRGRTHPTELMQGSTLDFWRVVIADKEAGRLLLYAEMKLPGEAWLEFIVTPDGDGSVLEQTASFRPKGVFGRLYWYAMAPFHFFIFARMGKAICTRDKK